ncbi:hypothetical protein LZ31DRAFT_596918 [Colletotrichum somersetense]|nr:hypothetical protein LZ31DRAFT_596918 [Colletotrichum somersetense]
MELSPLHRNSSEPLGSWGLESWSLGELGHHQTRPDLSERYMILHHGDGCQRHSDRAIGVDSALALCVVPVMLFHTAGLGHPQALADLAANRRANGSLSAVDQNPPSSAALDKR